MYTHLKFSDQLSDFFPTLSFWLFFAFAHPLLQPILWISEVLHASPGPLLGNLVPFTFLLGNAVAISLLLFSSQLRSLANSLALSFFIGYIGFGLSGSASAGLGDYNLQLDDDYGGKIVKGCPAYSEVRSNSMDNFNLAKYSGKWYEHEFHDYTQFKEVYDTSLGIKLTNTDTNTDTTGWVDDFALRGPSPRSNPRSWDKSPVANGAHYFLFGRVAKEDESGVLREKGFGVEFPNYIVDVVKSGEGTEDEEYKEAIQFQCLERGGVRVFEGINFLSRDKVMSEER